MKKYLILAGVLATSFHQECDAASISNMTFEELVKAPIGKIFESGPVQELQTNIEFTLRKYSETFDATDAYWDKDQSTRNWQKKCMLLKLAMRMGDKESANLYKTAIESKKYSRDCVDMLIAGYEHDVDVKEIRAFFWEHLAYADKDQRDSLIEEYRKGNLLKKDEERAAFWKKFEEII